MPGISCKPASLMSFFRSLRCEPITKRCASSRSRWMKYSTGSRGSSLMASRSGMNRVSLLAVAKGPDRDAGRETLFMPDREAIKLEPRDPVLYFIQRLRDEAHRFVIGSHRKLRKKDIREAGLQEIPGIGPSRKRALLHHFGTLKEIERASIADLGKVPGVSAESARKIFEFFHAQPG